jgi:uroporphyrinogen decarboxylase
VEVAHKASKPCILHSCGYFEQVIEDVIVLMRYDGRHSYEDKICPVEEAYELLAGRIAVMGGIDMDFMTRKTPREIYDRATAMLQRSKERGGYFLGTGNSVPETIPFDNYLAMTQAAFDFGKT